MPVKQKNMPPLPEARLYDTPAGLMPRYTAAQVHKYAQQYAAHSLGQIGVPTQHRSKLPPSLRAFVQECESMIGAIERQLILDAAAEIEGGEEAYAALVGQNRALREKLARTESNLQAAYDLIPRKSL